MVKNLKKGCILSICLVIILMLSACAKDDEATSMLKSSSEKFRQVASVKTEISVDTLFETVSDSTGIKMIFLMENTTDPLAGHAIGYSVFDIAGYHTTGEVEVYQLEEEGETVTYSRVNDKWIKETGDNNSSSAGIKSGFIDPDKKQKKFTLKDGLVDIDGKMCYELSGDMKGADAMDIFDIRIVNELADIETPDFDDIKKADVPFVIYIEEESNLPTRIYIDVTDVLNDLYADMEENTTVSKFTIIIDYDEYNNVLPIMVPEEVIKEVL